MHSFRRDFLKLLSGGLGGAAATSMISPGAQAQTTAPVPGGMGSSYDVRKFGATGNGTTLDTPAINEAISAAAQAGGGTVYFPAGTYACYSIRLKSQVALYLDQGATILAASTPMEGTSQGYDPAESNHPWESYQDFGHNHWHNSLIWGENIHDFAILGPGLIWGKGLSDGFGNPGKLRAELPGVGNKAIALKNCHNVILRDFSILQGGHFGILATGVDNFTIDNLKIDTNRDGIDIDCCRNVRVSNTTVNSPYDDGICPKSSFALGYPRSTENLTISNCYVTGDYEIGTLLDGTFKRFGPKLKMPCGRIKCGTESNGGFKNITISNCVFESCRGLALETVDGALLEDITFVGVTMRDIRDSPIFMRLGARMRGPKDIPIGSLKRVLISNVSVYSAGAEVPSSLNGIPGHSVEDIKISDFYLHHLGGGTAGMAALDPPENEAKYPEPSMFGTLPAQGFFIRHARNVEFSNVEIASEQPDARPFFWLRDVDGADFFRVKAPKGRTAPAFALDDVRDFRVFASRGIADASREKAGQENIG
jgi:polygalacturonase